MILGKRLWQMKMKKHDHMRMGKRGKEGVVETMPMVADFSKKASFLSIDLCTQSHTYLSIFISSFLIYIEAFALLTYVLMTK